MSYPAHGAVASVLTNLTPLVLMLVLRQSIFSSFSFLRLFIFNQCCLLAEQWNRKRQQKASSDVWTEQRVTYVGELLLFCHSTGFKLLELSRTRAALLKPGQTITGSIPVTIPCLYGHPLTIVVTIRNAIKDSIDFWRNLIYFYFLDMGESK